MIDKDESLSSVGGYLPRWNAEEALVWVGIIAIYMLVILFGCAIGFTLGSSPWGCNG
jgi:hypothetical protein